jgi:hypothetical protein
MILIWRLPAARSVGIRMVGISRCSSRAGNALILGMV